MADPKFIRSRDNPLLVRLRKLAGDPAGYRKQQQLWLEGEHLCSAYLQRGGVAPMALIAEAAWQQPVLRSLALAADELVVLPQALLDGLSTLESAAPIGFVIPAPPAGELRPGMASLVLDRLQDAGNVGNLLRSAAAFGCGQVLALKGTTALWSPKALRAAMGAHFALHLVEGLEAAELQTLQLPLLATSSHATQRLQDAMLPWPCAWVLGHEGQGIAPALQALCSLSLRIPQPGGEESLNVAAAAAVCLYESARQRAAD